MVSSEMLPGVRRYYTSEWLGFSGWGMDVCEVFFGLGDNVASVMGPSQLKEGHLFVSGAVIDRVGLRGMVIE